MFSFKMELNLFGRIVWYDMVLFCYVFVLVLKTSVSVLKPNTHRSQRTETKTKWKTSNVNSLQFFQVDRIAASLMAYSFIRSLIHPSMRSLIHSFNHCLFEVSSVCPSICLSFRLSAGLFSWNRYVGGYPSSKLKAKKPALHSVEL